MEDKQAELIVEIFKNEGMRIELGAQYSVQGQIAQLLNGCQKLIASQQPVKADGLNECGCDGFYQLFGIHRPGCSHAFDPPAA